MILLTIFLLILAAIWAAIQWAAAHGLRNALEPRPSSRDHTYPIVSVIIPARNEAGNIRNCLQSVAKNSYPADRLEIIVVDDCSEDATAAIAKNCIANSPYDGRVVTACDTDLGGNKHRALAKGIRKAKGDIVLTTDADCHVGAGWIYLMISCFEDDTQLVAGPVGFDPLKTSFDKLQAVEFMGLVAFGAGSIGAGKGTICNSANLAYRRTAYLEMQLEDNQPAADELLLQHLSRDEPQSIRFCHHAGALVTTPPASSLEDFWQQRIRWASMGTRYPDPYARGIAVAAWLFHALLLVCTGLLIVDVVPLWPVLIAWILKIGSDAGLMLPFLEYIDEMRLINYFLPAELLHPFYIAAIGIGGTFGKFSWKD